MWLRGGATLRSLRAPLPVRLLPASSQELPMYLAISKGPRKTKRNKTKRLRAAKAAKNRKRRNRIYVRS